MRHVVFTFTAIIAAPTFATSALAHAGHVGELAGHDHLIAGVAIGAAIGLTIWGALRGKGKGENQAEAEAGADAEADAEPQEA